MNHSNTNHALERFNTTWHKSTKDPANCAKSEIATPLSGCHFQPPRPWNLLAAHYASCQDLDDDKNTAHAPAAFEEQGHCFEEIHHYSLWVW
jgi:hypothetical protein